MPGHRIKRIWQYDPTIYAPPRYKKACEYESFIPEKLDAIPISLDLGAVGLVSEAENAIRSLNSSAVPALRPLARLLLRTESIASSKVEGMQIGPRELARAEARLQAGSKVSSTAIEVLSNIRAMELAVHEAAMADPFTVNEIVAVHHKLMEKSSHKHMAGQIRTQQNWIGGNDYNPCGADFVPPPPEYVYDLLSDLCNVINDDVQSPLVQAALIHAQFETIHPFDDGNGRTGRALVQIVLRRRGLAPSYIPPISVVLAANKDRYIQGLTDFREGPVSKWIEYFASATAKAANLAKDYLDAVRELSDDWRKQLRSSTELRGDATAWDIIDILSAHPIITAQVAAASTDKSKAPVYQAIQQLEQAGVLIPLSQSKRNQSWEAVGLLDLLAGLESGRGL